MVTVLRISSGLIKFKELSCTWISYFIDKEIAAPSVRGFYFFKIIYFIFRQRVREGKREGEKHRCVVDPHIPPIGDLAHNPGMCPAWESNWWPCGSQAGAQSTESYQPGLRQSFSKAPSLFGRGTETQTQDSCFHHSIKPVVSKVEMTAYLGHN